MAIPPLYQGVLNPGVNGIAFKGADREFQAVKYMEDCNGDDGGQVKPDSHIEVALPPFQQGSDEVPPKDDPYYGNGDIDGPFQFRVFLGSGISEGEGYGGSHNNRLPAPEIEVTHPVAEHSRFQQPLGGVIHPCKNGISHKGKDHCIGVQGAKAAETKPRYPVRYIGEKKHECQ